MAIRGRTGNLLILALLAMPAFGIEVREVELSPNNTYNGTTRVYTDSQNRMWFQDTDVPAGVTLLSLTAVGVGGDGEDHPAVTLDTDAGTILGLTSQTLTLDVQAANRVLAGPTTGADADPTFRALVAADIPSLSSVYHAIDADLTDLGGLTAAQGDLIFGNGAGDWAKLAKNTTATRYLSNTGTSNAPAWAQINLANGITGTLSSSNVEDAYLKNSGGDTGTGDYIFTGYVQGAEGRFNGAGSKIRLIPDSSGTGIEYMQAGLDAADTGAVLHFSRYGTVGDNISEVKFWADNLYLTDNLHVGKRRVSQPTTVTVGAGVYTANVPSTNELVYLNTTCLTALTLADGTYSGQWMCLLNIGGEQSLADGAKVEVVGASRTLSASDSLMLIWNSTKWVEQNFTDH